MSRRKRPYLPGTVFHLTNRTSGKEPWFGRWERDAIQGYIADALDRTDTRLVAFTILSNHFHLIVKQGTDPLARLMQPICRRTALLVRRIHGRTGHIFQGQYHDVPCGSVDHLRAAIYYVHRNPVKAGLCTRPEDYPWSSHYAYRGSFAPGSMHPALTPALNLFADSNSASDDDMYRGYERFADWRRRCDALLDDDPKPPGPLFLWGDLCFARQWRGSVLPPPGPQIDLRDIVAQALRELAPGLDLQYLRLRRGGRVVSAVRRQIIIRAAAADHRGVAIARYLNISDSTVSRVASEYFATRMFAGRSFDKKVRPAPVAQDAGR